MICVYIFVLLVSIVEQLRGNELNISTSLKELSRQKRSSYQKLGCADKINSKGMSLINKGIQMIDPTIIIPGRFYEALEDLYNSPRKHTMDVTIKELTKYNTDAVKFFNEKNVFEAKYIYLYTTNILYKDLNTRLRNHDCTYKSLDDIDRQLAPFAAVLWSTLYYWPALKKETGQTYRGIDMQASDINKYNQGFKFVWNQFVSSSRSRPFSKNVIFIINNYRASTLNPRRIKKYSWKPAIDEALYCPGVQFRVLKKTYNTINNVYEIFLESISKSPTSSGEKLLISVVLVHMISFFHLT